MCVCCVGVFVVYLLKCVVKVGKMKTVAERLKHARELKEWSQAQVAAASGLSQSTIGNIEAGTRKAKGSLHEIAKALGVSYEWLANGVGEIKPEAPVVQGKTAAGLTPAATELALLFDLIPEADRVRRASAYSGASRAILDVLQP